MDLIFINGGRDADHPPEGYRSSLSPRSASVNRVLKGSTESARITIITPGDWKREREASRSGCLLHWFSSFTLCEECARKIQYLFFLCPWRLALCCQAAFFWPISSLWISNRCCVTQTLWNLNCKSLYIYSLKGMTIFLTNTYCNRSGILNIYFQKTTDMLVDRICIVSSASACQNCWIFQAFFREKKLDL